MDTNDPSVAKHRMEQKLKITGFIERITIKMAAINQYIENNPTIMTRIDYHKLTSRMILLGNEWRELINEWHALQTRRSSPNNMHGMQSIVSRTKDKATSTLHRSNQLLQAALRRDPKLGEGGPPGGIPITPAAIIKPSLTLKPGGVRRKRDCY